MFEVLYIFVCVVLCAVLAYLHNFKTQITIQVEAIKSKDEKFNINFEEIKEELLDLVHDTIQNLSPPSAIDHIAGAFSQFMQMKMMKSMKLDEMLPELPIPDQED